MIMPKKVPVTSRLAVTRIVKLLEELPAAETRPGAPCGGKSDGMDNGAVPPAADSRQLEIGHGG
jgi:hypothetical protein